MNHNAICIAVPVRANKDIWILGDVFVTEAIAILMEMQNQRRDELYIYSQNMIRNRIIPASYVRIRLVNRS